MPAQSNPKGGELRPDQTVARLVLGLEHTRYGHVNGRLARLLADVQDRGDR